ncbi:MAG: hypothetical protein QGG42_13320 [Phycisphaerae bacterium]|jgi:hypothetical protein|nr:hypothetical protein [Phycisphaerae bacterium]
MTEDDKLKKAKKAQLPAWMLAICFCGLIVSLSSCSHESSEREDVSEEKKMLLRFYDAEAGYLTALEKAETEQQKWDITAAYDDAGWLTYDILEEGRLHEHPRPAARQIAEWPLQRRLVYFLQQPDRVGTVLWMYYPEVVSRLKWTVQDLENIGANIDSMRGEAWGSEHWCGSDRLIRDGGSKWSEGQLARKLLRRLVNQNFKTRKQFDDWFSIHGNSLVWASSTKTFVIRR